MTSSKTLIYLLRAIGPQFPSVKLHIRTACCMAGMMPKKDGGGGEEERVMYYFALAS